MLKLPKAFSEKSGNVNVIVETPRGSRNKFNYDPEHSCFKLEKVLPSGLVFPLHFGFVPNTKGGDGDPLDVLVLMEPPVYQGCLLECKPIGLIEILQKEKGKKEISNDRIIAIPIQYEDYYNIKTIGDIKEEMIDDIIDFFKYYNGKEGKELKVKSLKGQRDAMALISKNIV